MPSLEAAAEAARANRHPRWTREGVRLSHLSRLDSLANPGARLRFARMAASAAAAIPLPSVLGIPEKELSCRALDEERADLGTVRA